MATADGGFEKVREQADGHPMVLLFQYAARYRGRLALAGVLALVMRGVMLIPDLVIAATIDRVIASGGAPGLLAEIGLLPSAEITGYAARVDLLYQLAGLAITAWVVLAITRWASRYIFQSTAQLIQHDLRTDTYAHMQRLSMEFYDDHQTGGMMSILNADVNRLENFFNTEIRQIIRAVVMAGVIAAVMLYLAPVLALVVLAPVPLIAFTTAKVMVWLEPKYQRIREDVARLNTQLSNNLSGIAVVKSFDRYAVEEDRIEDVSQDYRDRKIEAIKIRKGFFASLRLLVGIAFVVVLVVGGLGVIRGAMTLGTFTLFFLFLRRLRSPMQRLGKTANKYKKAKSSAERVFGILGHEPVVQSPADPVDGGEIDGAVSFEDVTFGYDGTDQPVLDHVDLSVTPGTTIGIAGPSGSGKSTLVKLLPRFYDPTEGTVRIDDTDVSGFDLQVLRDEIGVVEQQPYMFSGTIRENIAYGDMAIFTDLYTTGETSCDAAGRVQEAAELAGADEFIEDLPAGYHTQVGERGVKLSGGQRQRVSLARALLNDPSIMVLDEATSDVDTETEELIQANLSNLVDDRTAFVIAHRLSTIQDADTIVVLDDGEIVETGNHDELIQADGTYAALWAKQSDRTRFELAADRDVQYSTALD